MSKPCWILNDRCQVRNTDKGLFSGDYISKQEPIGVYTSKEEAKKALEREYKIYMDLPFFEKGTYNEIKLGDMIHVSGKADNKVFFELEITTSRLYDKKQ